MLEFLTEDQRQRRARIAARSASSRLYNGDVSGTLEAFTLHLQALNEEAKVQKEIAKDWNNDIPDGLSRMDDSCSESLENQARTVSSAILQYRERVEAARVAAEKELFNEWVASGDETLVGMAEAAIGEDWASLAI